ncbi:MAG TPA: cysteate synthase [Thermoanaerobaculia bacterium]|nr:cysteate synthase [Thermoanaerobaculia bacterium]
MGAFTLVCLSCGREHEEFRMRCQDGCDALLRARYAARSFRPAAAESLFKFSDWLPCQGSVETGIGPVVYECGALGRKLGLERLYAAFNGYWPERGAYNSTGTFKDLEALPTVLAFREHGKRRILLSSAGNTARAFAHAVQVVDGFEVILVVPEGMLHRLWLPGGDRTGQVKLVAVQGSQDYYEAITLGDEIARRYGLDVEGGARNVARRDGMGTVMLEAARLLGRLPDHYVQAVGSGTGGIAVYEAALRLRQDSRFEDQPLPRLHLGQNAPFLPIHHAWTNGQRIDPERCKGVSEQVYASVLANRNPPFGMAGGVAEALRESRGATYAVETPEAEEAARSFERLEGIDLEPAAAVAVAVLRQAVEAGAIRRDELVLLNLTGGGLERIRRDFDCVPLEPVLRAAPGSVEEVASIL